MDKGAEIHADGPEMVHVLGHLKARGRLGLARAAEQHPGRWTSYV